MSSAKAARASTPGTIVSTNPATGVPLGEVPVMGAKEVRAAAQRAREAQTAWAELPLKERCRRVKRFSSVLLDRSDEVIDLIVKEAGKTRQEALLHEIVVVADLVNYFAKQAPKILANERISMHLVKHKASYLSYVPRGVVGVIGPWNFPLSIPLSEVMMALIAGNGVVLKPSEYTPLIALKAKEICEAAGLPADLFQVVTGYGETGAAMLDSGIQYCIFTGSVATGRKVGAACGERLIPCTLELGGKAPAVVCADADLDRAAQAIVWGGFANSGQICCSVERVYAHEAVHDELLTRIVDLAGELRQGDAEREQVDVGAMTMSRQVDHVDSLVQAAVEAGAKLEIGGARREGPGQFYKPTILSNVRQDMDVMRTETFGPVIPVMRVRSEAEAIELANDSHLGLLAYVFTRDREKGRRLAEKIEAGTVLVNDVLASYGYPETPWGGVKASGIGRTHSAIGLRDMCEIRHINYDRVATRRELWWYPYTEAGYRRLAKAMKFVLSPKLRRK